MGTGGDNFDPREQNGGLQNDVWWTTGAKWRTVLNEVVMSSMGEFEVRLVSDSRWVQEAATYDSRIFESPAAPYET